MDLFLDRAANCDGYSRLYLYPVPSGTAALEIDAAVFWRVRKLSAGDRETPLAPKPKSASDSGTEGGEAEIDIASFHLDFSLAKFDAYGRYPRQIEIAVYTWFGFGYGFPPLEPLMDFFGWATRHKPLRFDGWQHNHMLIRKRHVKIESYSC